jgi:hypothetical protein
MNQRNNPAANAGPKAPITASKVQVYESEDGDINHDIPDPPMMNSSDKLAMMIMMKVKLQEGRAGLQGLTVQPRHLLSHSSVP